MVRTIKSYGNWIRTDARALYEYLKVLSDSFASSGLLLYNQINSVPTDF